MTEAVRDKVQEWDRTFVAGLPRVAFDTPEQLPACSAVYLALKADATILYVGRTKNLVARWYCPVEPWAQATLSLLHEKYQALRHMDCAWIAYAAMPEPALRFMEAIMIKRYAPPLNKVRPFVGVVRVGGGHITP